jgi:SAM-dependent methyltransferase
VARLYGSLVGSKDNYEPDRSVAEELAAISPQLAEIAATNRHFQARAVSWLAGQGVTQFLDLGCGMPTDPNIHQTAREIVPDATVAYVDSDPVVVNHMTTFARPGSGIAAVQADVGDPEAVRAALDGAIDFTRPVAVLMCALLHFYQVPEAREIVAGHAAALAPGSYFVVSVIGAGGKVMDRLIPAYSAAVAPLYPYTEADTAAVLDGLDLIPPGIAAQDAWRPGWAEVPPPNPSRDFFGHVAVARVPDRRQR